MCYHEHELGFRYACDDNSYKVVFGFKKRKERKRVEWRERRREEWKRIVKLNFIIWFDIKFNRERNCKFFWINLSFALNIKLSILIIKYNLILIPNFFNFKKF